MGLMFLATQSWAALAQASLVSLFALQRHRHLLNRMPNASAPGPIACESCSHMPFSPQRHHHSLNRTPNAIRLPISLQCDRSLLRRVRTAIPHTHLTAMSLRHALSYAVVRHSCAAGLSLLSFPTRRSSARELAQPDLAQL